MRFNPNLLLGGTDPPNKDRHINSSNDQENPRDSTATVADESNKCDPSCGIATEASAEANDVGMNVFEDVNLTEEDKHVNSQIDQENPRKTSAPSAGKSAGHNKPNCGTNHFQSDPNFLVTHFTA